MKVDEKSVSLAKNKGGNILKVTIDLENLELLVKETTEKNIEAVIKEQVTNTVNKTIDKLVEKEIKNAVSANFQRFVDEYIKNTTIKVGGNSYWDDEEQKEYTVEQYIKKELKARLESKTLKAKGERLRIQMILNRYLLKNILTGHLMQRT